MTVPRRTLAREIRLDGIGLHTGLPVAMRLLPDDTAAGIVFVREGVQIPAVAAHVSVTLRSTTLSKGDVSIHTVEHVLSALAGMGVHDARVELSAPEPPALDGSALPLAAAIRDAGLRDVSGTVAPFRITSPVFVHEGSAVVFAVPSDVFRVTCFNHHDHPLVGGRLFDLALAPEAYLREVAPARTYGFEEELQALHAAGLARGGSIENAVLIYPDRFSSPLRFPDEMARHKTLDLLGDLALLGRPIVGHVFACLAGHALHVRFVRRLLEAG